MPDRDQILSKVRSALGRTSGQPVPAPPPPRLVIPQWSVDERIRRFRENFRGETFVATDREQARDFVASKAQGFTAVASNSPVLSELGISGLPNVETGFANRDTLRSACIAAGIGITSASYAIADPGALVILSGAEEERLISLAPPRHIAVIPAARMLTSLDELFTVVPDPALESSSMVLIGGPSRKGDIEMTLTLGVHGPREVYVVIVE
jgi:L-lactate dehydrogenase complex protein LldG